jgi:hypothetical protein
MARARNIKPGFFKNEVLGEMDTGTRLLFIGLWTLADREGRLEDRPRRIKMELFPYDSFDVDPMLNDLQAGGFLLRYDVDGKRYIQLVNFVKHQDPHYREKASEIPPPNGHENKITATNVTRTQRSRILERDEYKCQQCGSEEQLCIDHVIPVSRGGDSSDDNLQVLCLSCNTKKSNKVDSISSQRRVDVQSKESLSVPLNPDSLIPDSLNTDSLIPDSPIPDPLPLPPGEPAAPRKRKEPETAETWKAYSDAYFARYKTEPVRNATVNALMAGFVKRLGVQEAPHVAAFFLRHNNAYYVRQMHSVKAMVSDAEKLRTEWATNTQVTATRAQQADRTQTNLNAFSALIAEAQAKEAN